MILLGETFYLGFHRAQVQGLTRQNVENAQATVHISAARGSAFHLFLMPSVFILRCENNHGGEGGEEQREEGEGGTCAVDEAAHSGHHEALYGNHHVTLACLFSFSRTRSALRSAFCLLTGSVFSARAPVLFYLVLPVVS